MTETVLLTRQCPACGSSDNHPEVKCTRQTEAMPFDELRAFWSGLFKERVFFTYHRCSSCGLLFNTHFFTSDQLNTLYSEMAPNMDHVTTDAILATQRGYFDEAIAEAPKGGDYLEIGPDVGYITAHAADDGRFGHLWLVEPNLAVGEQLAAATKGAPHTISTNMEDLSIVPDGSVGLAVMIHVLDHLINPVAMLEQIRRKLRPDGVLAVVTHNEKSMLRYVMRLNWPPFCLQHPQVYNPQSMSVLMKRSGFERVEVRRSKNYFPLDFMVKQAAWSAKVDISKMNLPKTRIGLRLGNIMTLSRRA